MPFSWGGAGGGAMSGAQIGSFFGPWGTALGGIGGGILGGLFGGKKNQQRGGGIDPFEILSQFAPSLLSGGQEQDIVNRLLSFNDTPNQPLGQLTRSDLMERLDPNYVPQFFRNDVLNPFLNAQFRLGREQMDRDITRAQEQFQRMGAYFTPDQLDFTQRIAERQNLAEQDFLGNLGFQGGTLAEQLRTDAIARALGLESVTAGVMDNLQSQQARRIQQQLGFLSGGDVGASLFGGGDPGVDPLGFIGGGGLNGALQDIFSRSGWLTSGFSNGSNGAGMGTGTDALSNFLQSQIFQNFKQSVFPNTRP